MDLRNLRALFLKVFIRTLFYNYNYVKNRYFVRNFKCVTLKNIKSQEKVFYGVTEKY